MSARTLLCLVLTVLVCAGCALTDPYQRDGMWQPTGVVPANIAAMVADPNDLIAGHGETAPTHYDTPIAVNRVWTDQPKGLDGKATSSSSGGTSTTITATDFSATLGGGN